MGGFGEFFLAAIFWGLMVFRFNFRFELFIRFLWAADFFGMGVFRFSYVFDTYEASG
jgi:hypothetical protein